MIYKKLSNIRFANRPTMIQQSTSDAIIDKADKIDNITFEGIAEGYLDHVLLFLISTACKPSR
jgi:hypothetical protein